MPSSYQVLLWKQDSFLVLVSLRALFPTIIIDRAPRWR
jgi:hypothetical protein